MNRTILKKSTLLIALCMVLSVFASCSASDDASVASIPATTTPSVTEAPTEITEPVETEAPTEATEPFVPGTPFLLSNIPVTDVSFIPDTITISQDIIDRYSFVPSVSAEMPHIYINTEDGSNSFATEYMFLDKMNDEIEYVGATISTDLCDETMVLTDVEANVKVRGNFTLNYIKKPIRIKFDKKQNLLGLHNGEKFKNWVLLADWKDLSMQNNMMAFYLGNAILGSDGYYCTDFRNVELYLNGEYWGVYLLVEQQEVKDGRFSVPEVEDDYEGTDIGYLCEYDGYYTLEEKMPNDAGDPTFTIDMHDMPFDQPGYTVKSDIYHDEQLAFLANYVQNAYTIVYEATQNQKYLGFNDDYTNLVEGKYDNAQDAISSCIDIQALVDTYILNEIACDADVAWSSFYLGLDMTANGSHKLIFEGPWDFDSAFGITPGHSENWMYAQHSSNPWFALLKDEQWFQDLVAQKWNELKQAGVLDNALALSQYHKTVFFDHYARNFAKWSERVTEGNSELAPEINTYTTQGEAADYQYRWLKARFTFLDSVWNASDESVSAE